MGPVKFRDIFRKEAYVSAFLISYSTYLVSVYLIYSTRLLHTVKNNFQKTHFGKMAHKYNQPLSRDDLLKGEIIS